MKRNKILSRASGHHCHVDLAELDHRLRAAVDIELEQDGRDMRLDRRLGNAELVGDLLVEKAFRQHRQDTALLRRQRMQPVDQVGDVRVLFLSVPVALWRGDIAGENRLDAAADVVDPRGFGDEAGCAEFQRAADRGRIIGRGDDDDRQPGKFERNAIRPEKPLTPGIERSSSIRSASGCSPAAIRAAAKSPASTISGWPSMPITA